MGQSTGTPFTASAEVVNVPIRTPILDDDGNLTRTWILFFQQLGLAGSGTSTPGPPGAPGATGAAGGSASYLAVDPRAYGAVADGVTDDGAAISSAIAAGGLFLQSGLVFAYTNAAVSAAFAAIANDGWLAWGGGTLRMLPGPYSSAITLTGTTRKRFRDIVIDGNGNCGAHPVFFAHAGSDLDLIGCIIVGESTGEASISLSSVLRVVVDNCTAAAGLITGGTTTYSATHCRGIPDLIGGF